MDNTNNNQDDYKITKEDMNRLNHFLAMLDNHVCTILRLDLVSKATQDYTILSVKQALAYALADYNMLYGTFKFNCKGLIESLDLYDKENDNIPNNCTIPPDISPKDFEPGGRFGSGINN